MNYVKLRERVDVTGRCINCKRHAVPGNIRCEVHIQINRLRSLAWRIRNPEARAELKQTWRDQGRCELCPEHDKVVPGKLHCEVCLVRFRGYYEARKEEGMCARLGCPYKARDGVVHCRDHRKSTNDAVRYKRFLNNGKTLQVIPGVVLNLR